MAELEISQATINRVLQELLKRVGSPNVKGKPRTTCLIGYTAEYALYVHEDLEARHKVGKSAQFLMTPYRELVASGEISKILGTAAKHGVPLERALYTAGLRIQRESQKIVPVDTGNLRGSAFTRLE